jgi:hypothetical protein
MKLRHFTFLLGLTTSCFLISCGGETATQTEDTTKTETATTPETAAKKYTLTPFSESPAYSDAKIELGSYKDGKFAFTVTGTDYKLGEQTPDAPQKMCANSGKGQHIHLIIDNAPYSAQYTADFEYEVEDGEHYMLAFLSRSYHESIKTQDAHILKQVTVANKTITAEEDFLGPMLNYSRPKGTYVGKANTEKVMLDFYLNNVQIGTNFFVKAEINGEEHMIDTWQPYYITGLPMGDNKIKLTLVDDKGERVNSPRNPVERVFTLKADPTEGN